MNGPDAKNSTNPAILDSLIIIIYNSFLAAAAITGNWTFQTLAIQAVLSFFLVYYSLANRGMFTQVVEIFTAAKNGARIERIAMDGMKWLGSLAFVIGYALVYLFAAYSSISTTGQIQTDYPGFAYAILAWVTIAIWIFMAGSKQEVAQIGKRLLAFPLHRVYTCHCTGSHAFPVLKGAMGDRLEYIGTGRSV